MTFQQAPAPFSSIRSSGLPHPVGRNPAVQAYAFSVTDVNGGAGGTGDIAICDPITSGVFLIWFDRGNTIEAALFAVDATHTTEMISTTTADWSGGAGTGGVGAGATAGDVSFYYNSTAGKYYLANDLVDAATFTFNVARLV